MAWRLAKSLETLRSQVNAAYPGRDKSADGSIGDAAHASRASDHNPWVKDGKTGIVTAIDITHDPKVGLDSGKLADALRASRDPRIKYIISNRRICSGAGGTSPWRWRKYNGANPHNHHVHLSVESKKSLYDSVEPWAAVSKLSAVQLGIMSQPDDPGDPVSDEQERKPGFFRRVRNWVVGAASGVGLGGIGYLTDWQVAVALFAFLLIVIGILIALFFVIFDAKDVRDWIKKQVT
jgi:hypothetical protein